MFLRRVIWYADRLIALYFFKSWAGNKVTVNGEPYRAIINDYYVPELDEVDVNDIWFQQGGAIRHTANE